MRGDISITTEAAVPHCNNSFARFGVLRSGGDDLFRGLLIKTDPAMLSIDPSGLRKTAMPHSAEMFYKIFYAFALR
jgi:hypothetical protein